MTDQEINEAVTRKLHPEWCGQHAVFVSKPYATNIAAAWEIVEKCPMALVPFSSGHWYATTMGMPERENECFEIWTQTNCATKDECSCGLCVVADTAPMAICLAFLKLDA